jgi:hypothetical protein
MSGELSIVPIFATPFAVVSVTDAPGLNGRLLGLFNASRVPGGPIRQLSPTLAVSGDDLLVSSDPAVQQLANEMYRGVYSTVSALNEFSDAEFTALNLEARAWVTIIKTDGSLPATNYPLTAWCAMYCVAAPPPGASRADSGVLRLHETRLGSMFQDATNSSMRVPFRPSHYAWQPVPGEMAVFPASLTHEIALLRAAGELVLVTMRARFIAPGQQGLSRW